MKKRISAIIMGVLTLFAIVGLVSCDIGNNTTVGGTDTKGNEASGTRDVYAVSLVSGISYLSSDESDGGVSAAAYFAPPPAATRPESITDADVSGIEDCILMFEKIIAGGGVDETVKENSSENPTFSEYKLEMTITLHNASAETAKYTLYFNETGTKTKTELDDGVEEREESTTFEGIAVFGEEIFIVRGVKEVETEGAETETSIEFRTYKNIGIETPIADEKNYVKVEKSSESGEYEYEYTFVKEGAVVREIEIEYKETKSGVFVSFEIEKENEGTSFEIKKSSSGNFIIEIEQGNIEDKITVIPENDGSYRLAYSNGFAEYVNKN